jgi:hypothetical protein
MALKFKQLETGEPRDIEVMADNPGELFDVKAVVRDMPEEYVVRANLVKALSSGTLPIVFVIPGDEVEDLMDEWPELEEFTEEIHQRLLDRLDDE